MQLRFHEIFLQLFTRSYFFFQKSLEKRIWMNMRFLFQKGFVPISYNMHATINLVFFIVEVYQKSGVGGVSNVKACQIHRNYISE